MKVPGTSESSQILLSLISENKKCQNYFGTFTTAGRNGKCQKSTFYTLKAPIRKINIFFTSEKPK